MTLAEYNRLLDLAARAPVAPAAAPVAGDRVERRSARSPSIAKPRAASSTLAGQVLQSGVSRVPLISGATLVDANAGGRPVPLVADGQTLNALIAGPGPFAI